MSLAGSDDNDCQILKPIFIDLFGSIFFVS